MNIFNKRPLAMILCIGLGGFLLFTVESPMLRLVLLVLSFLPLILSFILRRSTVNPAFLRIISATLLLSFLLSFTYFDLNFKLYKRFDDEVKIVGVVEEVSQSSSYTMRLTVKTESIDQKRVSSHIYAYPTKIESAGITEGSRIGFFATLGGFSEESAVYNISNGIGAYANDIREIEILERDQGGLSSKFKHLRSYLSRYAIMISDSESGSLLCALLLGERDYLPDQLRLDFRRTGISHILALSGMHLAILSIGIGKLLTLFNIKKKARLVIVSVFVIIYMTLTGFSVSVCRAGIMLIIASFLFLLGYSKDSLTSLSIAVFVICLFTPYAIYDISLWLSALATYGIIVFADITKELDLSNKKRIVRFVILSFLTSMFAISSTLLISTNTFDGFSIMAPLATMVISVIAEIIMYLGCAIMLVGWLIPLGWVLYPFTRLLYFITGILSSFKYSYVSSNFSFVKISIIIYTVLFFMFTILNIKKKKLALNILVICFMVITIFPTIATMKEKSDETVAYYGQYKTDLLLVRSESSVCLINSSNYSKSTAYDALDLLDDAKVTYLDMYYLTHYSWALDDDIETLLYNVSVDAIYLPSPRNDDEKTILKIIRKTIEDNNTEIVLFRDYETVKNGKYSINLLYSAPYGETSMNAIAIANKNEIYTYLSSGLLAGENEALFRKYISLSDYVVFGDHGKKYKDKIYLEDCYEDIDGLILHSDNVFLKQENMSYFIEKGCKIYSHPSEIIYLKQ